MLAVDRDHVSPGDVISFTIRVASHQTDPIGVEIPPLGGFELQSRTERSDVTTGSAGGRTTTIQLQLRANAPGEWRLGPVNVRQGATLAQGDPVTVTVQGGPPAPVTASLSPRLAKIIQRAPPPDALGQAGITVAISDEDVPVGEQVDVVTIAWFDRDLRRQLRRAPTVESPHMEGVWSYPQPVPGGIAATRQIAGKWYDLFVLHQVVFPLTPGRVAVSPARLQYSVPLAYQFFSQEEAYKLKSDATSFWARPLPDAGRDPGFAGAVGRGLTLSQTLSPTAGRQGEAFTAEVTIRGEGNVALWPQPDLRWPGVFRVYPEAAHEALAMRDGRLSGTKTFRFLLVADSAGALAVPPLRYAFFDLSDQKYRVAEGAGAMVIVAPRGEAVASRAEPPPIRLDSRRPIALTLKQSLPDPWWWLLLLAPPLVLLLMRLPRRQRRVAPPTASTEPLTEAEHRLGLLLRKGRLPPEEAAQVAALRDRLQAARFAELRPADSGALIGAANALLARVNPRRQSGVRRWRERTGVLVVLLAVASGGAAQTPPEELYQAGAYRAAAEGFRRRALESPDVASHWFNLGDAAYRAGDDAIALMAWVRAARLTPRDGSIRRALLLVAPADLGAASRLWVSPFTPDEFWLVGLVVWLIGWAAIIGTRRFRGRWVVLLVGGGLLIGAGAALDRWYDTPLAVVATNVQLRLSPHELAPAVGEVAHLGTVRLGPVRGGWVQVDAGADQQGWVRRDGLEPLSGVGP
jgi:BatD DUF11 like domain